MIISDEQARIAARYQAGARAERSVAAHAVSPELMAKVLEAVEHAPDVRTDRVAEARTRLEAGGPDCHDVASKMISRIVCDNLR